MLEYLGWGAQKGFHIELQAPGSLIGQLGCSSPLCYIPRPLGSFYLLYLFGFWTTPVCAQVTSCSVFKNHLGAMVRGPYRMSGIKPGLGCIQGKYPPCSLVTPAPGGVFKANSIFYISTFLAIPTRLFADVAPSRSEAPGSGWEDRGSGGNEEKGNLWLPASGNVLVDRT